MIWKNVYFLAIQKHIFVSHVYELFARVFKVIKKILSTFVVFSDGLNKSSTSKINQINVHVRKFNNGPLRVRLNQYKSNKNGVSNFFNNAFYSSKA